MAKWGAKVSQPNKDVKTCPDKDLVFSSDWNTPKILGRASGSLTVEDGQNNSIIITHNYGFVGAMVYIDLIPDNYSFADATGITSEGHHIKSYSFVTISNNQIEITIYNFCGSERTFHIYCLILRENVS